MEAAGLNSLYLDSYRDNIRMSPASTVHNPQDFRSIMERVYGREQKIENLETEIGESLPRPYSALGSEYMERITPAITQIDKTDELYHLCLELETFIIKILINGMRNTVQKSGLIDEGFAGKIYEDMLYDEYAKDFTKNANFGLAEQAYKQLKGLPR